MKILICEDEITLAKVLQEKFEREEFSVVIVASGDEIVSAAQKEKPDIILLDLVMPKLDGLQALALMKKDIELKNIPVIILSNLNDDEKIKKALDLGVVDYVVKASHPINEVVEKVYNYVLKIK
jgi:DNA-binding response OmpR family regulator